MAISPLDIQAIVAVIRQQMVPAVVDHATAAPMSGARSRKSVVARSRGDKSSSGHALRALIANRVSALRHDDPDRGRKAFRIFLECVLINEMGGALLNDSGFSSMLDHIQHEMERDPRVATAVRDATARLLSDGNHTAMSALSR